VDLIGISRTSLLNIVSSIDFRVTIAIIAS
jgi:hypothetical protein